MLLLIVIIKKNMRDCVKTYTIIETIDVEFKVNPPPISGTKWPFIAEIKSRINDTNIKKWLIITNVHISYTNIVEWLIKTNLNLSNNY